MFPNKDGMLRSCSIFLRFCYSAYFVVTAYAIHRSLHDEWSILALSLGTFWMAHFAGRRSFLCAWKLTMWIFYAYFFVFLYMEKYPRMKTALFEEFDRFHRSWSSDKPFLAVLQAEQAVLMFLHCIFLEIPILLSESIELLMIMQRHAFLPKAMFVVLLGRLVFASNIFLRRRYENGVWVPFGDAIVESVENAPIDVRWGSMFKLPARESDGGESSEEIPDAKAGSESFACIVCKDSERHFAAWPCGHLLTCKRCLQDLRAHGQDKNCIFCAKKVLKWERVFIP